MINSLRSALSIPALYNTFSILIGGPAARTKLIAEYIRPRVGDRVLDIGCGTAQLLNYLPEVDYTGFDLSPEYIEAARRTFPKRGRFFCQAVSPEAWKEPATFDLVLAIGVVHHLPDSEALQLFELAKLALKPGGRLVTLDGCYVDGQSPVSRFFLSRDRGEFVRSRSQYEQIVSQVFVTRNLAVRHDLLRVPYTHLIMECTQGN